MAEMIGGGRGDWVPLRTLTVLRWVAIAGQSGAIAGAKFVLDLDLAIGPAVLAVGASVLVNLFATFLAPRTRRLTEREAALFLTFDILQLGALLAFTGGLHNPFALLILAPVTIAATILHWRAALALGGLALAVATLLLLWHIPIVGPDGPVELPLLLLFGFWAAIAVGIAFLGVYAHQVAAQIAQMGAALAATQMALAREQRLTDLGHVVAAAAHELGTPLATIKLAAAELVSELDGRPEQQEDMRLIVAEADRCRDILRTMGRAAAGDTWLDAAPLEAVLREAAEPHLGRGKTVEFLLPEGRQPVVARRPEVIHGLRNLVQNAVDFAAARVAIEGDWDGGGLRLRIADDGPGFSPSLLDRIGDPYMRGRPPAGTPRPGYEGMGLGLFIAKTLLERTGARLSFANGPGGGAVVNVAWPPGALAPARTPPTDAAEPRDIAAR